VWCGVSPKGAERNARQLQKYDQNMFLIDYYE